MKRLSIGTQTAPATFFAASLPVGPVANKRNETGSAVSNNGRAGIKKMVKRLGFPAYLVAALAAAAEQPGLLSPSPATQGEGQK